MTEIYLHIVARMADYMATHPYGVLTRSLARLLLLIIAGAVPVSTIDEDNSGGVHQVVVPGRDGEGRVLGENEGWVADVAAGRPLRRGGGEQPPGPKL